MSKVKYQTLRSAVVTMNNSVDEYRSYEISANVNVKADKTVGSIDNGVVRELNTTEGNIATFNAWSDTNKNYSFTKECDECAVIEAITAFIADVKAKVAEGELDTIFV